MDYMTLKETAEKWNVTPRQVNYLCSAGRIPGAVKMASVWLVPKNADKPVDGRTKQGKELKNAEDTFYIIGSAVGPHPYPQMVKEFQKVISVETKKQILEKEGRLPDCVLACVGGGSNAIGTSTPQPMKNCPGSASTDPNPPGIPSY